MGKSGIYQIRSIYNDMRYIGQSNSIESRWTQHIGALNRNNHRNIHLQRVWNKYGKENLEFSILEECNVDSLNDREIFWIKKLDTFKNGFNMTKGGDGGSTVSIVCLNNGEIYESIIEVEEKYNIPNSNIVKCCKGERKYCGVDEQGNKLVWRYYEDGMKTKYTKEELEKILHKESVNENSKKIICTTTKEIFSSITEAENTYGIFGVRQCCVGKYSYSGEKDGVKLQWMYYDDFLENGEMAILENPNLDDMKIICLNDRLIFDNIYEASIKYNVQCSVIRRCLCKDSNYKTAKSKLGNMLVFMKYGDFLSKTEEYINQYFEEIMSKMDERIICIEEGKVYDSAKDASKNTGIREKTIRGACSHKNKTAYMKHWIRFRDYIKLSEQDRDFLWENRIKKIICLESGRTYQNAKEIAEELSKKSTGNIIRACKDNCKAYGFSFRFIEEDRKEILCI